MSKAGSGSKWKTIPWRQIWSQETRNCEEIETAMNGKEKRSHQHQKIPHLVLIARELDSPLGPSHSALCHH